MYTHKINIEHYKFIFVFKFHTVIFNTVYFLQHIFIYHYVKFKKNIVLYQLCMRTTWIDSTLCLYCIGYEFIIVYILCMTYRITAIQFKKTSL